MLSQVKSLEETSDPTQVRRMHKVPQKIQLAIPRPATTTAGTDDAWGTTTAAELEQCPSCHSSSAFGLALRELTHAVDVVM